MDPVDPDPDSDPDPQHCLKGSHRMGAGGFFFKNLRASLKFNDEYRMKLLSARSISQDSTRTFEIK